MNKLIAAFVLCAVLVGCDEVPQQIQTPVYNQQGEQIGYTQQPQDDDDDTLEDMLIGGAVGYMAGSALSDSKHKSKTVVVEKKVYVDPPKQVTKPKTTSFFSGYKSKSSNRSSWTSSRKR